MTLSQRIATTEDSDSNLVSYWQHGEEVYRLKEYERVQFDTYGLPLGARWECSWAQFKQFRAVIIPDEPADHTVKACIAARIEKFA